MLGDPAPDPHLARLVRDRWPILQRPGRLHFSARPMSRSDAGGDYLETREVVPGEPVRQLDVPATIKHERLMRREYAGMPPERRWVFLDGSPSLTAAAPELRLATANLVLTLASGWIARGAELGLCVFSSEPRVLCPPGIGAGRFAAIRTSVRAWSTGELTRAGSTVHTAVLSTGAPFEGRLLVGDLLEPAHRRDAVLLRAARMGGLTVLTVDDPGPTVGGGQNLVDAENGKTLVGAVDATSRAAMRHARARDRQALKAQIERMGAGWLELSDENWRPVLARTLQRFAGVRPPTGIE